MKHFTFANRTPVPGCVVSTQRITFVVLLFFLVFLPPSAAWSQCTSTDDEITTPEDTSITFDPRSNDDLNNQGCMPDETALIILTQPTNGAVTLAANGQLLFTPNADESGCSEFRYAVNTEVAPLTANDDFSTTPPSTPVMLDVLGNDVDPQGDELTVTVSQQPTNGTVTPTNNGMLTYTPDQGFSGTDVFTYSVSDGNGNTDQARVSISVNISENGLIHYVMPALDGCCSTGNGFKLNINTDNTAGASGYILGVPNSTGNDTTFFSVSGTGTFRSDNLVVGSGQTRYDQEFQVRNDGIKVVSYDNAVNVQITNENGAFQSYMSSKSNDGLGRLFFAGQPTSLTPGSYVGNNQGPNPPGGRSFISVMATEDNTSVTVTRPPGSTWEWNNGVGSSNGVFTSPPLDSGQTYMFTGPLERTDYITGTKITSTKPISAASGAMRFAAGSAGDNGWDALVPVPLVGSEYIIESAVSNPDETTFVATEDNTVVSVDGAVVATIDEGEFYTLNLVPVPTGTARYITSTKPVYAFQFSGGDPGRGENGLALVAPINDNGRGFFRFYTPNPSGPVSNLVTVKFLTLTSAVSSVTLVKHEFNAATSMTTTTSQVPNGGFTATAVPSAPQYSTFQIDLERNSDYTVSSQAFIQLEMFLTVNTGGAIAYLSGFSPPTLFAADERLATTVDGPITFNPVINDVDITGGVITLTSVDQPDQGGSVVNNNDNSLTFTPQNGFVGESTFAYTITDGDNNFSTATITISVQNFPQADVEVFITPVVDAPTITFDDNLTGLQGNSLTVSSTIAASTDTDGSETLAGSITIASVPNTLSFSAGTNSNGTWTISTSDLPGLTATSTTIANYDLTACINATDAADCNVDGIAGDDVASEDFCDDFRLEFATSCDLAITNVVPTGETCPGEDDGSIVVSATCTTCTTIQYSNGGAFQASNTFADLAPGGYTITVRDVGNGNCTASTTVTVNAANDTQDPVARCQDITIDLASDGTYSLTAAEIDNGSSDNCGTPTLSIASGQTAFGCSDIGQTVTVTLRATDGGNRSATCPAQVTVSNANGACAPGAGLDFDGVNDIVVAQVAQNSSDITLSAHFNVANATNNFQNIVIWLAEQPNHETSLSVSPSGVIRLGQFDYVNGVFEAVTGSTFVADGEWHQIAASKNGLDWEVYLDGVLEATLTISANNEASTDLTTVRIGHSLTATGNVQEFLNGQIDEVRLHSRSLCDVEIAARVSCELSAQEQDLLAYYQFNQGLAAADNTGLVTAPDVSTNGNTATLSNFSLMGPSSNWIAPGGVMTGTSCGPPAGCSPPDRVYNIQLRAYYPSIAASLIDIEENDPQQMDLIVSPGAYDEDADFTDKNVSIQIGALPPRQPNNP